MLKETYEYTEANKVGSWASHGLDGVGQCPHLYLGESRNLPRCIILFKIIIRQPGWLSGLAPPSTQGVILETWDRVPRQGSLHGACFSLYLPLSRTRINKSFKKKKKDYIQTSGSHVCRSKARTIYTFLNFLRLIRWLQSSALKHL